MPYNLHRTALTATLLMTTSAHADFNFPDFSETPGLTLVGDALVRDDALTLTEAVQRSAGGAWFTDRKQRVAQGFETTFIFGAKDVNGFGADGIAFVIQNASSTALGGTGGAMGYGSNRFFDEVGIANSIAIEIDLWDNSRENDWADLNDTHISVQSNGLLPNDPSEAFSLGVAPITVDVEDQQPHVVQIVYTEDGVLSVFIDDLMTPQLVVEDLDIASTLSLDNGTAWVGLTAATGRPSDVQSHLIFSWEFVEPIPTPGVLSVAVLALGANCRRVRRR